MLGQMVHTKCRSRQRGERMSYYTALAEALRTRRCTEDQVRDILAAVREATVLSGNTPEEEFGPAKLYAENFTGPRKRSQAQVLRSLTLPIAIVVMILARLFALPEIEFIPWGAVLGAGVFLAVWALIEAAAGIVNRRMPSGVKIPSSV
jgi:hypothetical protein